METVSRDDAAFGKKLGDRVRQAPAKRQLGGHCSESCDEYDLPATFDPDHAGHQNASNCEEQLGEDAGTGEHPPRSHGVSRRASAWMLFVAVLRHVEQHRPALGVLMCFR